MGGSRVWGEEYDQLLRQMYSAGELPPNYSHQRKFTSFQERCEAHVPPLPPIKHSACFAYHYKKITTEGVHYEDRTTGNQDFQELGIPWGWEYHTETGFVDSAHSSPSVRVGKMHELQQTSTMHAPQATKEAHEVSTNPNFNSMECSSVASVRPTQSTHDQMEQLTTTKVKTSSWQPIVLFADHYNRSTHKTTYVLVIVINKGFEYKILLNSDHQSLTLRHQWTTFLDEPLLDANLFADMGVDSTNVIHLENSMRVYLESQTKFSDCSAD